MNILNSSDVYSWNDNLYLQSRRDIAFHLPDTISYLTGEPIMGRNI